MTTKKIPTWIIQPPNSPHVQTLVEYFKMPRAIATILVNRNLQSTEKVESFFDETLSDLPSPDGMKGIKEAVEILVSAVASDIPIILYGDYDVDGLTSLSVLYLFFKEIGKEVDVFIPNRFDHGYGLNSNLLKEISNSIYKNNGNKESVIVTVDCGISDVEVVQKAKQLGFHVIITDHHRPPETLPAADAIINPLQPGCSFSFKSLAGVGVAFYLVIALRKQLRQNNFWNHNNEQPNLKNFLDLVAIGTICDMVPLNNINRIIAKAGLETFKVNTRVGLQSINTNSGIQKNNKITAADIGYKIGPRINAAGRMGDARVAFDLLCSAKRESAERLAGNLEEKNNLRKKISDNLYLECCKEAEKFIEKGETALILSGRGWHQGVLGIIASRLVKKYSVPAVLISIPVTAEDYPETIAKGSGRASKTFNLHDALTYCSEVLEGFGGHKKAGGLTIKTENINNFRELFEEYVELSCSEADFDEEIEVDYQLSSLNEVNKSFVDFYNKLEPFGMANQEPVFTLQNVKLQNLKIVGNKHLRFTIKNGNSSINGIGFDFAHLMPDIVDNELNIAFHFSRNYFRGVERFEINLIDVQT